MRDKKLERKLLDLVRPYPTLRELRAAKPKGSEGILNFNEDQPDAYPSSQAVDDFLVNLD